MAEYIVSKIDNLRYCKSNGQFAKYLQIHNMDHKTYYETFESCVCELCILCFKSKKNYQNTNTYANTCGSKKCATRYYNANRSFVNRENQKKQHVKKAGLGYYIFGNILGINISKH